MRGAVLYRGLRTLALEESIREPRCEAVTAADAVVMTERETGASRGFGFVTMANRKDAPRVIEALNGADLKGSSIVVNIATERR